MDTNITETNELYIIPKRYRITENLHIVFWLIKDICWCTLVKPLGLAMIVPTLSVAVFIAWQNRQIKAELYHNLAVMFWIIANSYWMVSEFFHFDEKQIVWQFTGKNLAVVPFAIGILCLFVYYVFIMPAERAQRLKKENTV
ncbi:MAG TPA: hypothetical protein PLS51_05480 [Flavobacterium sp.]|jgi:hypothetical protein|nr:hypothetical protein [Flavobacterium sp.]HPJ10061.1 hypothetical protein [Flavobacterium sp.]